MTADKYFVDTNLWIYAHAPEEGGDPRHERALALVQSWMIPVISNQIIHEYYNVMLRLKISDDIIQENIRKMLLHSDVLCLSVFTLHTAFAVKNKYAVSWWDSLVVAAALESRCKILYTEDLQHGQDLDGLLVVNPFV